MDSKQKEGNEPQNQSLDAFLISNDQLQVSVLSADVQQLGLIKEEAPGEWRPGVDQQEPVPLNIKEEEEELWTSLDEEKLSVKEEADATVFPFSPVPMKSDEDEEKPVLSQLPPHQVVPASSSTDQMTAASGGEDCGGAETTRNTGTLNTHEDNSSSSQTGISDEEEEEEEEDDNNVNDPDFQLSDSMTKTKNRYNTRKQIRSPESGAGTVKTRRKIQTRKKKSYSCDLCGKRFVSKAGFEAHTRIHTGEKPFTCPDCGKSFKHKPYLTTHMRSHTGHRPFNCGDCGRSYSQKANLITHMKTH